MDNIKIYLPYNIYNSLYNEAYTFGLIKKDGNPNINLLCNLIIINLYSKKYDYNKSISDHYYNMLIDYLPLDQVNRIIDDIIQRVSENFENQSYYHNYSILLRPRKEFEYIFETITEEMLNGLSLSKYFRSLISYYFTFSQDERELILFNDIRNKLNDVIENRDVIRIKLDEKYESCLPLGIVKTKERLYNYFIYFIENDRSKLRVIHLNKIKQIINTFRSFELSSKDIDVLNNSIENGIQYVSDKRVDCKVVLTNQGLKLWGKFYLNRPTPTKIESTNTLYFSASYFNLYSYFTRFGSEVNIIYPRQLKREIYKFHLDAINEYQNEKKK